MPRSEAGRDPGGGVVGIDVADDPVGVPGERRHDRHLAADEDGVQKVAAQAHHPCDQPEMRDPLGDQQPAVHARQADRVDAQVAQPGDQLAVDHAAQDRRGDLEALGVGHPQAALEPARDPETLEPLRNSLAAAVDEDDGPAARHDRDLVEHLALVGDRRPTELDDEDFAHVEQPGCRAGEVSARRPRARQRAHLEVRERARTVANAAMARPLGSLVFTWCTPSSRSRRPP